MYEIVCFKLDRCGLVLLKSFLLAVAHISYAD